MRLRRTCEACLFLAFLATTACRHTPPRVVTLTVLGFNLDTAAGVRRDAIDEFTRTTGIAVDLVPTWGTSEEQLSQTQRLLRQHATTPDVYLIDVVWPGTLAADLLDLSAYRDNDARSHLPALLENDTVGGRLVALPYYANVGMLYYRSDLLSKYGYSRPPDTWEELESMAARIQQAERAGGNPEFWGFVWQGGSYEGLTCNALEWQASEGGGNIIESSGTITVNNPRAIDAMRRAARWVGTISPPGVVSYVEADGLNAFRAGNAAFLRHWTSGVLRDGAAGDPIQGRFGVTILPAGARGRSQVVGGFHVAVSRYSLYPGESARLALYLTGRTVQARRTLSRGVLPTLPQLYSDPEVLRVLPYVAGLRASGAQSWVARPSTIAGARYRDVSRAYYTAVHDILQHKAEPGSALAGLEQKLGQMTGLRSGAPQ